MSEPLINRIASWYSHGDQGLSSLAIFKHMTNTLNTNYAPYPIDQEDLHRCLLLLDLIPEWKPRMGEMAKYGDGWSKLIPRWDELTMLFLDEYGLRWKKRKMVSGEYSKTYDLMDSILDFD